MRGSLIYRTVQVDILLPENQRRTIVCLCGSTRFKEEFVEANLRETLAGKIVLSIGCDLRTDQEAFGNLSESEMEKTKKRLDALHFAKIDLADEILVLNVGGYIGWSTSNEIAHAVAKSKRIRYLVDPIPAKELHEGQASLS